MLPTHFLLPPTPPTNKLIGGMSEVQCATGAVQSPEEDRVGGQGWSDRSGQNEER